MGSPMPRPLLDWQPTETRDDQGRGATRELCYVAHDREGCEWIVARHDDGTWNFMRWDGETPLAAGMDHASSDAALAAANAYAATVLR